MSGAISEASTHFILHGGLPAGRQAGGATRATACTGQLTPTTLLSVWCASTHWSQRAQRAPPRTPRQSRTAWAPAPACGRRPKSAHCLEAQNTWSLIVERGTDVINSAGTMPPDSTMRPAPTAALGSVERHALARPAPPARPPHALALLVRCAVSYCLGRLLTPKAGIEGGSARSQAHLEAWAREAMLRAAW